jgi:hypothetical protein
MDPQYKKMMLWVAAALLATLIAAVLIVEWTMRHFQ